MKKRYDKIKKFLKNLEVPYSINCLIKKGDTVLCENNFKEYDFFLQIKMISNVKINEMNYIIKDMILKYSKRKILDLFDNKLTSLPDLSELTKLKKLWLEDNSINLSKNEIREEFNVVEGCEIYV